MRKYTRPTVPAHWQVAEVARVNGQVLTPGRMLKVKGERGTFAFLRHVTNTHTGTAWIDVRDASGALRAFRAERVSRVLRKTTRVVPVAGRTLAGAA
jgi:hypothetical protein